MHNRLIILVGAGLHEEQVMKLLIEREARFRDANFVLSSQAKAMDSMIVAMEKATGAMNEYVIRIHETPTIKMSYAHKHYDPWRRQGKRRAGRPR